MKPLLHGSPLLQDLILGIEYGFDIDLKPVGLVNSESVLVRKKGHSFMTMIEYGAFAMEILVRGNTWSFRTMLTPNSGDVDLRDSVISV